MEFRLLIAFLLLSIGLSAQVYQTNSAPYQFTRGTKNDTILVIPRGADTPTIGNTKFGAPTIGAIFYKTADSTFWLRSATRWNKVSVDVSGKLNISDTGAMLSPYLRFAYRIPGQDSIRFIRGDGSEFAVKDSTGGSGDCAILSVNYKGGNNVDTIYTVDCNNDTLDVYYAINKQGLISGGVVTYSGFDLVYYVSAAVYRKGNTFYTSNDTTITLPPLADADSSRSDAFVVNTAGQATSVQGVESGNPLTPQVDPDSQIYLTHVTLSPANPVAGVDTVLIYDELAVSEWPNRSATGVTVAFNSTNNPYRGIRTTETQGINNNDVIGYGTSTLYNKESYSALSLFIRLKSAMPSNNNIYISFFNGNSQVSNEQVLALSKTNTTSYQGISLSMSAFTWTNNFFDSIRVRYSGSAGITGLYLDFIYLQGGIDIAQPANFLTDIRRNGDDVQQQLNGVYTTQFSIADKVDTATAIIAGDGLVGGGTLSQSRTLRVDTTQVANKIWVTDRISDLRYLDSSYRIPGVDSTYFRNIKGYTYGVKDSTGGGTIDTTSLSNRIDAKADKTTTITNSEGYGLDITGGTQDLSANRTWTYTVDTTQISTRQWRDKLADSLGAIIATKGTGTVTSVATNNGTGITGGTITGSGTLSIDTTVLSTRAWRDKLADSLGALIGGASGITQLTGDVTAGPGSGSQAATLATVNANVGSFTNASITVNAKGLITAASSGAGGAGTVTSVGLTMPSAFSVANSPVTTSGTLAVTGAGTSGQLIAGDGSLANIGTGITLTGGTLASSSYLNYIAADKSGVAIDAGVGGTGTDAGPSNAYNFFIGENVGYSNTYMSRTIGIGKDALFSLTGRNTASIDSLGPIAIGAYALYKYTGTGSSTAENTGAVAIGNLSQFNTTTPTQDNTSIGRRTLYTNVTGIGNTAVGNRALELSTSDNNTAVGATAASTATGNNNVDIGYQAGAARTTGNSNVSIGSQANYKGTGNGNVAINAITRTGGSAFSGANNTLIGTGSSAALTTGHSNIFVGYNSGNLVTEGFRNVIISQNISSNHNLTTGDYNTMIGDDQSFPSATTDNQMVLGFAHYMNTTWRHIFNGGVSGYSRAGTLTYNASTAFDFQSTNGGLKLPSQTRAQRVAITSPAAGIMVNDTDSKAVWLNLNASTTTWGAIYAAQDTVATDANFTLPVYSSFVNLPTITADRTLTLPAPTVYENKSIIIKVANSDAGFKWIVSPAIKDKTDADLTDLVNDTVYTIFSNGVNWLIISIY